MILLYHKVAPETPSIWWVSVDNFDRQMADLQGKDVVLLDDYDPSNPRHVVITFDGIYENVWQYAFPILRKWNYPFELFVIGGVVGGDNAFDRVEPAARFATIEQLQEMAHGGGRLQWHTISHRRMDGLSEQELDAELTVPEPLANVFCAPHFRWFAYPHGDHTPQVVEAVRTRFSGALSCVAGNDTDRHQLNRETVFDDTKLATTTVAVIVACYNYRAFVAEAIESVLAQTRAPDEIIVIDDASTDQSDEIIGNYANRVRSIRNETNLGIVDNFNKAVSLTSSSYIIFLGADNRMRADCVELCKAALDANPKAGVAYTDMIIFGQRASALAASVGAQQIAESQLERHPVYLWQFPNPEGEALANFATRNFVHGSSMYRREAYDAVGGYKNSGGPEDHNLFHRIYEAGWGLCRVPHPLIEYRQHSPTQANTLLGLQLENAHLRALTKSQQEELQKKQHLELFNLRAQLRLWESEAQRQKAQEAGLLNLSAQLSRLESEAELQKTQDAELRSQRAQISRLESEAELQKTQDAELLIGLRAQLSHLESEAELQKTQDAELLIGLWAQISHLESELRAVRASRSWKLTAPMRLIGHFARGDYEIARNVLRVGLSRLASRLPEPLTRRLRGVRDRTLNLTGIAANSTANDPALAALVAERCAVTKKRITIDPLRPPEPREWPLIDIGIVTYNSSRWIKSFCDSLLALEYPKDRIAVRFVDNSSTDTTAADLVAMVPHLRDAGYHAVEVLRRPNLGFGAGHNVAIAAGRAPFCLVTNIDLTFEPDSLRCIAAMAVADQPEAAAWELRQKPYEHPKFYDPITGSTNWNSHACVLLRRLALEAVGAYDTTLFMYGEDVELSYRLRRGGYILRYCPRAIVTHYCYETPNQFKVLQYTGSTFANLYLRLKYATIADVLAVPSLALSLLVSPQPRYFGKVLKNLLKLLFVAPRTLLSRRSSEALFPFRTWDYDLTRDGAFIELAALPAEQPLVSVITRTYHGRDFYLKQALLSAAHQTWSNLEIIVVEDGEGGTRPVGQEVAEATGRVVHFIANGKKGRSSAGNAGLKAARGRWCVFLDDDDLLFADHVEVLSKPLLDNPDAVASYALSWEVLTDVKDLGQGRYVERVPHVLPVMRQDFEFDVLRRYNYLPIQSVLFARHLFDERGGLDEDMDALEDWVLWVT